MKSKKRFYSFDVLKFLASIFIVFHHFQQTFECRFGRINFYGGKFYFGYIVEFFFIISGFFLAVSLQKNRTDNLGYFLKKRIIRIYPMAMISIVAMYILELIGCRIPNSGISRPTVRNFVFSLLLVTCDGTIDVSNIPVNSPTWYLNVLILCNILGWICAYLSKHYKIRIEFLFAAIIVLGIFGLTYKTNIPFLNMYTSRGYLAFFWGAVLCRLFSADYVSDYFLRIASAILLSGWVLLFVFSDSMPDNTGLIAVFSLFTPIVLLLITAPGFTGTFLHNICPLLGSVSFEIFLWHMPLFRIFFLIVYALKIRIMNYALVMVIVTITIVLFSALMYLCIEKPLAERLEKALIN